MNEYYWEAVIDGVIQANSKSEAYELLDSNRHSVATGGIKHAEFEISEEHIKIEICKERDNELAPDNSGGERRTGLRRDTTANGRRTGFQRRNTKERRNP